MPSTTDRMKSWYFYPPYTKISKVVFLSETHTFITSICCVKCAHLLQVCKRMLSELDCIKCLVYWFPGWSVGKNNVWSCRWLLMAFLYSNICYDTGVLKIFFSNIQFYNQWVEFYIVRQQIPTLTLTPQKGRGPKMGLPPWIQTRGLSHHNALSTPGTPLGCHCPGRHFMPIWYPLLWCNGT